MVFYFREGFVKGIFVHERLTNVGGVTGYQMLDTGWVPAMLKAFKNLGLSSIQNQASSVVLKL